MVHGGAQKLTTFLLGCFFWWFQLLVLWGVTTRYYKKVESTLEKNQFFWTTFFLWGIFWKTVPPQNNHFIDLQFHMPPTEKRKIIDSKVTAIFCVRSQEGKFHCNMVNWAVIQTPVDCFILGIILPSYMMLYGDYFIRIPSWTNQYFMVHVSQGFNISRDAQLVSYGSGGLELITMMHLVTPHPTSLPGFLYRTIQLFRRTVGQGDTLAKFF